MKLLLAPDAFKGSLSAVEAVSAMSAGIRSVMPDAEIVAMPLADGGEGTLDVLSAACGGAVYADRLVTEEGGGHFAVIESARLIGLNRPEMQCDLFTRGSARLGEALLSALDAGLRDIRIALGGSATLDGGLGMLSRLGCRVADGAGAPVSADLNGMLKVVEVDPDGIDPRLKRARLSILSDVKNTLYGIQGAVQMYGPQKGLRKDQMAKVESAMQHWADVCEQAFGVSAHGAAGAGAAGGVGFALKLLGAETVSGAQYVMHACGFEQAVATADWVVTGEGRSDAQTLCGKLPAIVARKARDHGVKCALISGLVTDPAAMVQHFDSVIAATPSDYPRDDIIPDAAMLLQRAAAAWAEMIRQV